FHEHFPTMQDCLVAAYDSFFDRMVSQMRAACATEEEWALQVRVAVTAIFEFVRETASRTRMFVIEATSAGGPRLLERRFALIDRIAAQLRDGRLRHPESAALPTCTEPVLVAGGF